MKGVGYNPAGLKSPALDRQSVDRQFNKRLGPALSGARNVDIDIRNGDEDKISQVFGRRAKNGNGTMTAPVSDDYRLTYKFFPNRAKAGKRSNKIPATKLMACTMTSNSMTSNSWDAWKKLITVLTPILRSHSNSVEASLQGKAFIYVTTKHQEQKTFILEPHAAGMSLSAEEPTAKTPKSAVQPNAIAKKVPTVQSPIAPQTVTQHHNLQPTSNGTAKKTLPEQSRNVSLAAPATSDTSTVHRPMWLPNVSVIDRWVFNVRPGIW